MTEHKSCLRCGNSFCKPRKLSSTQWNKRAYCSRKCGATKYEFSLSDAISLFESGHLLYEISRDLGAPIRAIALALRNAGYDREGKEARKIGMSRPEAQERIRRANRSRPCPEHVKDRLRSIFGPNHPLWKGGVTNSGAYSSFTASFYNGDRAGKSVHTVLAEEHLGFVRGAKMHVHHKDHDKKNNSIENLVVMTASDHARYHMNKYWESKNG